MQLKERLERALKPHGPDCCDGGRAIQALLDVLELHSWYDDAFEGWCSYCGSLKAWPCPIVKAIEQAMGEGDK